MSNVIQIRDKAGTALYPITDVSLIIGLEDAIKLPPVKVATLPTASAETAGKMYYVGPTDGEYERYITSAAGGSYDWIDLGDTSIPLPSIADNLTTDDANTALSAKQGKVLDGKVSQLQQKVAGLEQQTVDTTTSVDDSINNAGSKTVFVDVYEGAKVVLDITSNPEMKTVTLTGYYTGGSDFLGVYRDGIGTMEKTALHNYDKFTVAFASGTGSIDFTISVKSFKTEFNNYVNETNTRLSEDEANTKKQFDTIDAQDGILSKTIQTVSGTDARIELTLNIPKGELFWAYAKWGDNIDSSRTAVSLLRNDDSTAYVALDNGVWTPVKPDVDFYKLAVSFYRTLVIGGGDFTFSIRKLQSITRDGSLPLYNGGLSANGSTWSNADRKTTRVILNDRPLFLKLNAPYSVTYMYGDEPDNLTDGSYITTLTGGGSTILDVDAKYIGFTIVKGSSDTFDDLRFIVTNANSNEAKLAKEDSAVLRESTQAVTIGSSLFPFVQGSRVNGVINPVSNRITSNIVNFKGTIVFAKNVGDGIYIMPIYRAKGSSSWTELSTWTDGSFTYTGEGEIYLNAYYSGGNISPEDANGIDCFIEDTPNEIDQYPVYYYTAIGHGEAGNYFDETGIILRKNRRYKISFDGVLASSVASGQILNIGAFNVDNPEQNLSIAYREAGGTTIPADKYIALPYDAFIRATTRLSKDAYLNLTIRELPTSITRCVKQIVPDSDKTNLIVDSLKCKQFLEGDLVTDVKDILVFGAGIDIVEGGEFYIGLNWAENAAGEYGSPHYNVGLIVGNVVDPYGTKERYTVALYGDEVVDGEHYDAISGETFAKRINDNEVAVFEVGYYLNGVATAATKIFNLQTKTFGAFQKCYINVDDNGTNRRFQIKQGETDIRTIHQITGMHNWDDVADIGGGFHYYAGNNPIKIGEYFYMMLCIGDYSPALVRTQDFVDFYFVCELPFGATVNENFLYNPTEEVALEYLNNRLYASCRGNKGRFSNVTEGVDYFGYNQIMSANFDDILAGTEQWTIVNLEPYWYEKPSMVAFNGKLFLLTGARGQWSYKGVEGVNLNRFKHMFFVLDRNMNILKKELMNPDDGWLHPTFQKYGNSVYSVNHTDVRNFTFFGTGNNRSELRLKRLDMQILGM